MSPGINTQPLPPEMTYGCPRGRADWIGTEDWPANPTEPEVMDALAKDALREFYAGLTISLRDLKD